MTPLKETMEELAAVAKELNAETDRLNEVIRDFEDTLNSMGVGVEAWLQEPIAITRTGHSLLLGYSKVEADWCITIRGRGNESGTPLLRAKRHVRIAAIARLDALAAAVLVEAKQQLAQVKS